jgi:hypothetical protein
MRILFAQGTPAPLIPLLEGHTVTKAKDAEWDRISNGALLTAAEEAGFDILLTTDKQFRYQQNLAGRKIAIVVLANSNWRVVRRYADRVVLAVNAARPAVTLKLKSRMSSWQVRLLIIGCIRYPIL